MNACVKMIMGKLMINVTKLTRVLRRSYQRDKVLVMSMQRVFKMALNFSANVKQDSMEMVTIVLILMSAIMGSTIVILTLHAVIPMAISNVKMNARKGPLGLLANGASVQKSAAVALKQG